MIKPYPIYKVGSEIHECSEEAKKWFSKMSTNGLQKYIEKAEKTIQKGENHMIPIFRGAVVFVKELLIERESQANQILENP